MKRTDRSLNVFSVSAIDVFASAMGAFMLILFVVLPFYPNISPEEPRDVPSFLSFVIFWNEPNTDIDLHVLEVSPDQAERRFSFSRHNRDGEIYPDSRAQLSVDVLNGPGVEIWETPSVVPGGRYVFGYHFYGLRRTGAARRVSVSGRLYHGEGYHVITPRILNLPDSNVHEVTAVIEVVVSEDGLVASAMDRASDPNTEEL